MMVMTLAKFASPLAQKIWDAMSRESGMADDEVPYSGFHVPSGLDPSEFERGINWLIHFKKIDKFVLHGQVRIRKCPRSTQQTTD